MILRYVGRVRSSTCLQIRNETSPKVSYFCTSSNRYRKSRPALGRKVIEWSMLGASCTLLSVSIFNSGYSRTIHSDADGNRSDDDNKKQESSGEPLSSKKETTLSDIDWQGLLFLKSAPSVQSISSALSTWKWPTTTIFSELQDRFSALLLELGRGPGSLYSQVVNEPPDSDLNPECEWDAEVRLGEELCLAERAFLGERRRQMKAPFAKLMGVPESEIDERDIPVVGIAGSGGGYRAMLMTIGSLIAARRTGLLDCVAYTAGVSGSCWALGTLYSGVAGSSEPSDVAEHLLDRIRVSYLDIATLDALVTPPTNKYLLSGILRKAAGPTGTVSLVDLYGTLLASRLYVPSDLSKLDPRCLSLHRFRRNVDNGNLPMPIFTAIQHATPPDKLQALRDVEQEKRATTETRRESSLAQEQERLKEETRFLWYEFTPYEVGCDEVGAFIPSWAFGRQFMNGKNIERRPELSFAILSGIFGSAFCASLKYYFREIEPTIALLPVQLYTWLKEIITENEKDLGTIHPVLPDELPNFLKGMHGQLRYGSPPDLPDRDTLSFMDAGAELNIPYYPLLRRNVDCIIALDASADSHDLWFTRAEELAARRGLRTWPRGAIWPVELQSQVRHEDPDGQEQRQQQREASDDPTAASATAKLARTQEGALAQQADKQEATEARDIPAQQQPRPARSPCEVWLGSSSAPSARLDDLDEAALRARDGLGVVYLPLLPHACEPGFDPLSLSTWRREVTREEGAGVVRVAGRNLEDGNAKVVRLLRAIWVRKRREREEREQREDEERDHYGQYLLEHLGP